MAANTGTVNIQLKVKDDGSVVVERFSKTVDKAGKSAERSFSGASVSVGDFNKKLATVGAGVAAVGIGLLVAKMAELSAESIKAASDYEEAHSKFNVVFAGLRQQAEGWVKVLTDGFAMSETEAVRYLSSLQDLLVPMGMARDKAADMSFAMTKLAADLGSFNNVKTADVINDMQSAMVGEYDTMKKYGVVLNATIVQQKAMAMGFGKTADEIDASEKAMAAYKIILESSSAAVGDMQRTADSYANTTKKLDAEWENFTKTLGNRLLPTAQKIKSVFAEILSTITAIIKEDTIDEKIKKIDAQIAKLKSTGRTSIERSNIDLTEEAYRTWVRDHGGRIPNNDEKAKIRAIAGSSIAAETDRDIKKLLDDKAVLTAQKEKQAKEEQALADAADKAARDKALADAAASKASKKNKNEPKDIGDAHVKAYQDELRSRMDSYIEFQDEYKKLYLSSFALERMEIEARGQKYIQAGADRVQVEAWVAAQTAEIQKKETEDAIAKEEERLRASKYWADGAVRAMNDYAAQASDAASAVEGMFTNAFLNLEDALVDFVMTGKASFSDLVNSMIADIVRLAIQQSITAPLASALASGMSSIFGGWAGTGTGSYSSADGSMTSTFATYNRMGNAFGYDGIHPFAKGGAFTNRIYNQPTAFMFGAGGAFGVMGEAGDEAVMPLTRTPSGELGVKSSGQAPVINVTINNQAQGATGRVESMSANANGGFDLSVIIEQIDGAMASGIGSGRSALSGALETQYGLNRAYGSVR